MIFRSPKLLKTDIKRIHYQDSVSNFGIVEKFILSYILKYRNKYTLFL